MSQGTGMVLLVGGSFVKTETVRGAVVSEMKLFPPQSVLSTQLRLPHTYGSEPPAH